MNTYLNSLRVVTERKQYKLSNGPVYYVAYDKSTDTLKFDPFTDNEVLRRGDWEIGNIDTDGDGSNDLDLTGVWKIAFCEYVKILNKKYPFIITDFDYEPKWNFWEPKTTPWDFDNLPTGILSTD